MPGRALGILVGYDGSPGSEQALAWAVREARARGSVVTLCQASVPGFVTVPEDPTAADLARRSGERVLAGGLAEARRLAGSREVRPLLAEGPAARVLCEHSEDAEMVVVGSRGHGGFAGLLLGSVSAQVAAHGHGVVIVVRGHWEPAAAYLPGGIAVGVDASAECEGAVAFAFEEARLHETPLTAVCALADAAGTLGLRARLEEEFEQVIERWEKKHPEVIVNRQVVDQTARTALLAAAYQARLVVVGARGRGGIRQMPLGSVSQAVLYHAACPVGVVHSAGG